MVNVNHNKEARKERRSRGVKRRVRKLLEIRLVKVGLFARKTCAEEACENESSVEVES